MQDIHDTLPPLEDGTVHIIHFSENIPLSKTSKLLSSLTQEDTQEFSSCVASRERERRLMFRAILRAVLATYSSLSPSSLRFTCNSHGKPFLHPDSCRLPLQFNLSHSGERGVIAVASKFQVGIDLEKIDRRNHLQEIAKRFFTPEEQKYLYADGDPEIQLNRFYYLWTRKEAVVKAMGESLPRWLIQISVLPSASPDRWYPVQTPSLPDGVLMSFDAGPGYEGALCAETYPERIEIIILEILGG